MELSPKQFIVEEMKNKGYTDKYIGWYLELIAKTGAEGVENGRGHSKLKRV